MAKLDWTKTKLSTTDPARITSVGDYGVSPDQPSKKKKKLKRKSSNSSLSKAEISLLLLREAEARDLAAKKFYAKEQAKLAAKKKRSSSLPRRKIG